MSRSLAAKSAGACHFACYQPRLPRTARGHRAVHAGSGHERRSDLVMRGRDDERRLAGVVRLLDDALALLDDMDRGDGDGAAHIERALHRAKSLLRSPATGTLRPVRRPAPTGRAILSGFRSAGDGRSSPREPGSRQYSMRTVTLAGGTPKARATSRLATSIRSASFASRSGSGLVDATGARPDRKDVGAAGPC